jgi:hypothetical protein
MDRRRLLAALIITGCCIAPRTAYAATGPASVYKVTITQFELYNGTSWVTVSDGSSTTLDIASVNAGAVAGTFFSGLSVPDGSYTQVRVTISNTFTISGRVGSNYTNGQISNGICATTATAADEAACTVTVPGGLPPAQPDALPTTLTVTSGVPSHKIRVTFNVDNAIDDSGVGGLFFPGTPAVTMTMIAL